MHTPRIFISATTDDLRESRQLVDKALRSIGCYALEQTNFEPDWRSVTEMLRDRIEGCQAVIHLAGLRYGGEPRSGSLPPGALRRSYTQMEYDMARELGKRVYVFILSEDYPYLEPVDRHGNPLPPEDTEKQNLQTAHRQELGKGPHLYERISSDLQLQTRILALREKLIALEEEHSAERQEISRTIYREGGRTRRSGWQAFAILLLAIAGIWAVLWSMNEKISTQTPPAPVAEGTKLVGKLASSDPKKLPPKVILLNEAGVVAELEVSAGGEFTSAPLPSGKFWLRFAAESGTAFQPVKIQGDASLQQIPIDLDKLVEWNFFSDGNANVALVVDGLVIGECFDRSFMASEVDQVIELPVGFSSYVSAYRSSTKVGRMDGLVKQTVLVARGEHHFEWVELSENRENSTEKDPLKDPKSGKAYVHSPNRAGASRDLRGDSDEYWTSATCMGMNCDSSVFDAARGTYIVRAGLTISVVGYQTGSLFWKARLRSPGGKLHAESSGESVVAGEKGFIPLLGGTAPSGDFTIRSELNGTIFDNPGEVAILGIVLVTREGREILHEDFAALPVGRDAKRRTVALHLVHLREAYADVHVTEALVSAGLMSQAMQWISDRETPAMRNPEQKSIIGLARLVFARAWMQRSDRDLAEIGKILDTAKQYITENHDPESREAKSNLAYWSRIKGQFLLARAAEGDQDEAYKEFMRSLKLREDILGFFPGWIAVVEAIEQGLPYPKSPSDPLMFNSMRDLFLALGDMGNFLKGRNRGDDLVEAVNHLRRGIRLNEALFKVSPNSTNAMEDLATGRRNLADLLSRNHGEEGLKMAVDYQRGSVELRKKMLERAPDSQVLILRLALAHHETAVMLYQQKDETGATGEIKECYRLLHGLANAGATFDEGVMSLYAELKRQFGGETPGGER